MSLRWQIMFGFVVAAMVPAGVLGWQLRESTLEQTRAEYEQRLDAITQSAGRRVVERRERERRAVARLCEGDFVVDRLLLDLQAGRFGPLEQDDLVERLPHLMRSMGLVALMLVDARDGPRYGRVFAAGHFPGRAGASEEALARAVEEAGERWFVRDLHVRQAGETHEVQALLTGCVAERGEARVIAVGGQVLDEAFVGSLAADVPPVQLGLTGPDAAVDASGEGTFAPRVVHTFEDAAGVPAARLVASIDDAPLRRRIAQLERRLSIILASALIAVLFLGFVISLSITSPLKDLESAASRVASGEMDTTITVRSGGEVGKALSAFNHMTAELQHAQARLIRAERIAAWRDIARRIAHEIKNPLMPIQTSIETMRKTHARQHPDFDEIFEESTLTILEEVERLKRIVTEFSQFARMPRPQPVELSAQQIAQHTVGLHAGGDVEVRMLVEGEPPPVRADREQLTQVLVNLVQNAADAARARHGAHGGHVDVIVSEATEGVRVEVVDDGPGIPDEEKGRIFEPYYTTKSGGTGLGLAIVHRIVSDHGGRIDVHDAEGGGAVFEIVLPREGPPVEAGTTATDTALPLVQKR
ncbi:MAG TPA: ATP-binding protein [Sandaracinaceae bacterium LLY-WYZ-13_1]|nr:ATP-binding protein [Sandaracinaceae bacterium LLY-WYZ-13_1]